MFQANGLTPNGLNPEDKTPNGVLDPMDGLMSDWSWRPRLRDLNPPVYVYSAIKCRLWEFGHLVGLEMSAQQPWSFPAYRGPRPWTGRLGGTR